MSTVRFRAKIEIRGINPFVLVSVARAARLKAGWRKPLPVRLQVDGGPAWRTNLMPLGDGGFYLYLHGEIRGASASGVGDVIAVTLDFDDAYKGGPVEPPPAWFAQALEENPTANAAWDALPPSRRKEILRYFTQLKTPQAKARHLQRSMEILLGEPGRFMARSWNERRDG
jgi:hypothetical protein